MIYLDTHVLVWLLEGRFDLFPEKVILKMNENQLLIAPIIELELQLLYETGKLKIDAKSIINELEAAIGIVRCKHPFHEVVHQAIQLDWTQDVFDRMITAQAALKNSILITKDPVIQFNYKHTFWDEF